MRAVVLTAFGGPDVLRLTEVPDPEPGLGQVRIAVHFAGVNPVDAGNRADGSWAGLQVPCILGYDVAGVVDTVGPDVDHIAVGDRVMAMTHFPDGAAGYAELTVVDAAQVAKISDSTSDAGAAATPLAGGTAEEVLARLRLSAGSRLLVLGGSGGVGLFLLQLAARQGIEAIGVGRRAMHDQMRQLGASSCIDYSTDDIAASATELAHGPVDAIADLVGGTTLAGALTAVRAGGQIAAIAVPEIDLGLVLDANVTFHGVLIQDDGNRTRGLAALLAEGTVRPVISAVLPLREAARAHRIVEGGHSAGKIVLAVTG